MRFVTLFKTVRSDAAEAAIFLTVVLCLFFGAFGCSGGSSGKTDVEVTGDSGAGDVVGENGDVQTDVPGPDAASEDHSQPDAVPTVVKVEVGTEGGQIDLPGGGRLEIPSGALGQNVTFEIRVIQPPQVEGYVPIGTFHAFFPEGLHFNKPATVTMPFELPEGKTLTPVVLWSAGKEGFVGLDTTIDWEGLTVSAQVEHFSEGGPGGKPACIADGDCVTSAPCQVGTCVDGVCVFSTATGIPCDDKNPCTTSDACGMDGICAGVAISCDDSDACTDDSCSQETGECIHVAISCDGANPCTEDSCSADSGCSNVPVAAKTACDDGNACTEGDACDVGKCVGNAVNCDDGNVCTKEQCAPESGYSSSPVELVTVGADDVSLDGKDVLVKGCVLSIAGAHVLKSLSVLEGGGVTHPQGSIVDSGNTAIAGMELTVLGDVTVDAASAIDADSKGYGPGQGPAPSIGSSCSSGAGHGGGGGIPSTEDKTPGSQTDDLFSPVELGSGSGTLVDGGRPGGGRIRLIVKGTLVNDGRISASAMDVIQQNGGGAGGSIHLTVGTLAGGGEITANGGGTLAHNWCTGGGGGGGRISVEADKSIFVGKMLARGGTGYQPGAAGTVVVRETGLAPRLVIDNGTTSASPTYLSPEMWKPEDAPVLVISGLAEVRPKAPLTLSGLFIEDTGRLSHDPGCNVLELTILGDAGIRKGGQIALDGMGYGPGQGPGAGVGGGWGSGGGHGGPGGSADHVSHPPGKANDVAAGPADMGSGGDYASGASGGDGSNWTCRVR